MSDLHNFAPVRAFDADGLPVAGALARFYQTGTLTLVDVFQDEDETILHPSPMEADASGIFDQVYCSVPVKVIVTDPDGAVLPGYPMELAFKAPGDQSAAADIAFAPTADIPEVTVQAAIESVKATSLAVDGDLSDLTDPAAALVVLGAQPLGATLTALEALSLVAGDMLYATAADTLVRLPKGSALQALRINAGATAPEWATPMFSKSFTSADQTITVAGLVTVAHGLGAVPGLIQFSLKCTSTDNGFAVNDVITTNMNNSTGAARNNSCYYDATNINVRYSDTSAPFTAANKTTGSSVTLDPTKWVLIIKAWV